MSVQAIRILLNPSFLFITLLVLTHFGCGGSGQNLDDTDSPSDSETEPESFYDCMGCLEDGDMKTCFGTVTGRAVSEDGSPFPAKVVVCNLAADYPEKGPLPTCKAPQEFDTAGYFSLNMGDNSGECVGYLADSKKFFKLNFIGDDDKAQFSIAYGHQHKIPCTDCDDSVLDLGEITLFDAPTGGQPYDSAIGGDYSFDELTLSLDSGISALSESTIAVREFPLDDSGKIPALVPPGLSLDKLFYIEPYYAFEEKSGTEATITIATGWNEDDTGRIFQLGETMTSLLCETTGGDPVIQGEFRHCADVTADANGDISFTTPQLTWIGVAKDN